VKYLFIDIDFENHALN